MATLHPLKVQGLLSRRWMARDCVMLRHFKKKKGDGAEYALIGKAGKGLVKQHEGRNVQLQYIMLYHVMSCYIKLYYFLDIISSLTFCGIQRVMDWAQKARLPKWDKDKSGNHGPH